LAMICRSLGLLGLSRAKTPEFCEVGLFLTPEK
jgi:hypothetical protein